MRTVEKDRVIEKIAIISLKYLKELEKRGIIKVKTEKGVVRVVRT
ncbi:MAG: hypothetical protein Q9M89_08135 [Persephonella sp.]|nr:hypothetical protein [Persephonella sp.]